MQARDAASNPDRTVHAITYKGAEVVRYDRSGKWYIEWPDEVRGRGARMRKHVGIAEAAQTAVEHGERIIFGLPGGMAFDRKVMVAKLAEKVRLAEQRVAHLESVRAGATGELADLIVAQERDARTSHRVRRAPIFVDIADHFRASQLGLVP